jgi:hypothetical protein
MLESCRGVGGGGHGCWGVYLPRRIWHSDSIAWSSSGSLLDAFYGRGEAMGCLEDAICGHDFRDRNGMVFVTERVAKQ